MFLSHCPPWLGRHGLLSSRPDRLASEPRNPPLSFSAELGLHMHATMPVFLGGGCFVLHQFWGIELKSPFMDRAISSASSELDFLPKQTCPSCSSWRGNSKEKSVGGAKIFVLQWMIADWLPPGKGVPTSWKGALEVSGGRSQGMTVPWAERQKCGYLIKYLSSWET